MFQINPTHSDQIAKSVQHDYQQAAANYRLVTACDDESAGTATAVRIGLIISIVVAVIFMVSQVGLS